MEQELQDRIVKLAGGNPGALSVVMRSLRENPLMLVTLEHSGLRGPEIWLHFKDVCGEDLDKFMASISKPQN